MFLNVLISGQVNVQRQLEAFCQLFQQLSLLVIIWRGILKHDMNIHVAEALFLTWVSDAAIDQLEGVLVLCARWYGDDLRFGEARDIDVTTERCLNVRDVGVEVQIEPIAFKEIAVEHVEYHKEVAAFGTRVAKRALVADLELGARVDARGNFDLNLVRTPARPATSAILAGMLNDDATSMANMARGADREESLMV